MSLKSILLTGSMFCASAIATAQSRGTLVVRVPASPGAAPVQVVHFDEQLPQGGDEQAAENIADRTEVEINGGQAVAVDECKKAADAAELHYRHIARHPLQHDIQAVREYACNNAQISGSDYSGVYGERYLVEGQVGQTARTLESYSPGLSHAYLGLHPQFNSPLMLYSGAINSWGSPWSPWGYTLLRNGFWYIYFR